MAIQVHGLEARQGETAFAFVVLRLGEPAPRERVVELLRYLAPLVPDVDAFVDELPEELGGPMQLVAVPWMPPEAGHAVDGQRRLIAGAGAVGVEAAWFFQTGTSLPTTGDDDDQEEDDEVVTEGLRALTTSEEWEDAWEGPEDPTAPVELVDPTVEVEGKDEDDEEEEDDDHDDDTWSHGPPPQAAAARFALDNHATIVEDYDWEDFGIAFKLAGPAIGGEAAVLNAFHSLWLAPYGGRHRNAAVTYDRKHHAAHLWVDRFAAPCEAELLVGHLLWIVAQLDQIAPIVHARFAGATMAQKYGGLVGDTSEPFVLGGNPLLAVYAEGGDAAVAAWLAAQREWSDEELAKMLREIAIEIVTSAPRGEPPEVVDATFDEVDDEEDEEDEDDDEDDDDEDDDDDDEEDDDDDDDEDDEAEGNEDEDRGRHVTVYAGEVLCARARAGKLDARAADQLVPVLDQPAKFEHRRRAVVEILGALRHRAAVPAMIRLLDETTIASSLDSIGKEDFVASIAGALGAIGDPAAIDALSKVVAAPGPHNDKPRPAAAAALAACLAAAPEPRDVDDAVLLQLIETIRDRNDGELNAETHFAYGRIARLLRADRRDEARRLLADSDSARDDTTAMLARHAALALASPPAPAAAPPSELRPLLHEGLTSLDYDHDYTVRNIRIALRVAEVLPELVDADDLVWLTRFGEADIRSDAHALLARLGKAMPAAAVFDRTAAQALDDGELVSAIGEPHVVGRAALIAEAGRRRLVAAQRAIVDACHDVMSRARQGGENLLDPDTRVLEAAVRQLREAPLDDATIALFDRMLRHSNFHVKWELLQAAPTDERLIGGMFHVLGERWGWQETTAKQWLAQFQGSAAYERERARAGTPAPDDDETEESTEHEDQDMN
jgi:hypothetical protein